jgi:hypothetical protein
MHVSKQEGDTIFLLAAVEGHMGLLSYYLHTLRASGRPEHAHWGADHLSTVSLSVE